MDTRAGDEPQHVRRRAHADERFLMAVAMKPDIGVLRTEGVRTDAPIPRFPCQEFIEEKAVRRQFLGVAAHFRRYKIRILISERKDAGGFDANERSILGDDVLQERHILDCQFLSQPQAALGNGGAAAFTMLRNLYSVTQTVEQSHEGQAQFRFLMVGELVGEKIHFPTLGWLGFHRHEFPHAVAAQRGNLPVRREADNALNQ